MIDKSDRDFLRFLWFDNIADSKPRIIQYRFTRLVFGLTPSPAILNSVIKTHLTNRAGVDSTRKNACYTRIGCNFRMRLCTNLGQSVLDSLLISLYNYIYFIGLVKKHRKI